MRYASLFFTVLLSAVITSCGVGSYSVSSGSEDYGYLSFTSSDNYNITAEVDSSEKYSLETVKTKKYKKDRKIKRTSNNTIRLAPGSHAISVTGASGQTVTKNVFISTGEHKIIEL